MIKPRRISEVIDDMLIHIPPLEVEFISKLEEMKKQLAYVAPEQEGMHWPTIMNLMYKYLGPIDSLEEDWKKEVTIIYLMPEYLLEYLRDKWRKEDSNR